MYKLHIFITFHAHAITVYTLVTLYEFACTCDVYSTFLNASTDLILSVDDQKIFRKGAKPGHENLLITGIICNFISIQSQTFWIFKT